MYQIPCSRCLWTGPPARASASVSLYSVRSRVTVVTVISGACQVFRYNNTVDMHSLWAYGLLVPCMFRVNLVIFVSWLGLPLSILIIFTCTSLVFGLWSLISDLWPPLCPFLSFQALSPMIILPPLCKPSRLWTASRSAWNAWRCSWRSPGTSPTDQSILISPLSDQSLVSPASCLRLILSSRNTCFPVWVFDCLL